MNTKIKNKNILGASSPGIEVQVGLLPIPLHGGTATLNGLILIPLDISLHRCTDHIHGYADIHEYANQANVYDMPK